MSIKKVVPYFCVLREGYVDHHNQSMNLNPTDVYHSIFYGTTITGGTFNMNIYFGHPENTTDSSVKRSKTKWKLCVHTTCVKKNVQWPWLVVTKFNKLISQFLWEKLKIFDLLEYFWKCFWNNIVCYQILMVSFYSDKRARQGNLTRGCRRFPCLALFAGVWFYFSLLSAVFSFVFVCLLTAHEYKECVVYGAMGNKMRPLKFDNKLYYFRNIFSYFSRKNVTFRKMSLYQ
jgi:hypothetical protein